MGDMGDTRLLPCGAFVHDTLEVNLSTERKRWDEAEEICSENGQDLCTDVDIIKNCLLELEKNSRKQIVRVWSSRTQTNARRCNFIEYDGEDFSVKSTACTQRRSFTCYSEITEPTVVTQPMTFPKTTEASPVGSQHEMKQTATAGMSGAAIGGLVAGLLVLFGIIVVVIILLLKRRRFNSLKSSEERKKSKKFYMRWYSIFLKKTRRRATSESLSSENQPPEVDRTSSCAIYTEILPLEDNSPGNGHGIQNNEVYDYELPDAANTGNNASEIASPNVYEVPVMGDDVEGRYDELQLSGKPNPEEQQHTYFELEKTAGTQANQFTRTEMSQRNSNSEWDGQYELAKQLPGSSGVIESVKGQTDSFVEKSDNNLCHNQTGRDHVYNNVNS